MGNERAGSNSATHISPLLLTVFLFTLAGLEARITLRDYVIPWSEQIHAVRLQPAWERAGLLSVWVGPEQTEFISFLRTTLPTGANLFVPYDHQNPWDRYPNLMQYYLYPRRIVACADNDLLTCIGTISNDEPLFILKSNLATWEIPEALNAVGYLQADGQGVYRVR